MAVVSEKTNMKLNKLSDCSCDTNCINLSQYSVASESKVQTPVTMKYTLCTCVLTQEYTIPMNYGKRLSFKVVTNNYLLAALG